MNEQMNASSGASKEVDVERAAEGRIVYGHECHSKVYRMEIEDILNLLLWHWGCSHLVVTY